MSAKEWRELVAATKEVTGDTRVDSVTIHSDYATLQARDGNYLWCDGSLRKDNSYPGASADTEDIADIDASIISILEARAASGDDETIRIMIDGERIAVDDREWWLGDDQVLRLGRRVSILVVSRSATPCRSPLHWQGVCMAVLPAAGSSRTSSSPDLPCPRISKPVHGSFRLPGGLRDLRGRDGCRGGARHGGSCVGRAVVADLLLIGLELLQSVDVAFDDGQCVLYLAGMGLAPW